MGVNTTPLNVSGALAQAQGLCQQGRLAEAEQLCAAILAVKPDQIDALQLLGTIKLANGRYSGALDFISRAMRLQAPSPEILRIHGLVLSALGRPHEAIESFDRAIKLKSKFSDAHHDRGNALTQLNRFDEALTSYDRALVLRSNFIEARYNRGVTLTELKRFDEALASHDRVLAERPDHADAHFSEALCRLKIGDFDRGWEKYEWRWETEVQRPAKRSFTQPLWLGQEEIAGKTILLHAEQGLGDTIQFCRYVPLVAARGVRVVLEVQKSLQELMSSLDGVAHIMSRGDPLPDFDLQCPLLSLPLAFRTQLETIPSAVPYLRASPQALNNWERRLGPRDRPRIGLVWSGNPNPINPGDHIRSIGFNSFLSLLDINATFVSLQKDVRAADAMVLKDRSDLLHFGDELSTFSDTAALISNLDLVISVDTSVAHLAGALGKPVWVLLSFLGDWRWLLDREDSPWYPTARLFRQDATRAWDNVIARVHAALHDFVQSSRDGRLQAPI
jgi:tetratricopeptide (TPR) repeat protein